MMKKVLSVCMLLTLLLCCSCVGKQKPQKIDSGETSGTETGDPTPAQDPEGKIVLVKDGKMPVDVIIDKEYAAGTVRSQMYSNFLKSLASAALLEIGMNDNGPALTCEKDYTPQDGRIRILLGETSYPESKQVYDSCAYDESGYRVVNGAVVIYGHTLEELRMATESFVMMLQKNSAVDANKQIYISIDRDAAKTFHSGVAVSKLPEFSFGNDALLCDGGDGARLFVLNDSSPEKFAEYTGTLKQNGFLLHAENKIRDNLFATYYKDDVIVDIWYSAFNQTTRMTVESGFDLMPKEETWDAGKKVCESKMTLFGGTFIAERDHDLGLLMVIRLEDGRFVIIDGNKYALHGERLYQILREQAPDPDHIVIATWIITHSHPDHIGAFEGISQTWQAKYSKTMTIESIFYNLPGYEQGACLSQFLSETDTVVRNHIKKNYGDSRLYKVHPGNVTSFANLKIEVLATQDSNIFATYPEEDNQCCLLLKMTLNGQTIMITSDMDWPWYTEMYGDYLKCDILQAVHHGASQSIALYRMVKPSYILFFEEEENEDKFMKLYFGDKWVVSEENTYYREHWFIGQRIIEMDLPYEAGTYRIHEPLE